MLFNLRDDPITDAMKLKNFPKKKYVSRPGYTEDTIFHVALGSVSIGLMSPDGHKELLLGYAHRGDWFLTNPGNGLPETTIQSRTDSEIFHAPVSDLLHGRMSDYPSAKTLLLDIYACQTRTYLEKLHDITFLSAEERVLKTLLSFKNTPEAMSAKNGFQVFLTRQEIAALVGCTREHAGKALEALDQLKLINVNGKSILVNSL